MSANDYYGGGGHNQNQGYGGQQGYNQGGYAPQQPTYAQVRTSTR